MNFCQKTKLVMYVNKMSSSSCDVSVKREGCQALRQVEAGSDRCQAGHPTAAIVCPEGGRAGWRTVYSPSAPIMAKSALKMRFPFTGLADSHVHVHGHPSVEHIYAMRAACNVPCPLPT
eukprot:4374348-Amphidinium_carterae.1